MAGSGVRGGASGRLSVIVRTRDEARELAHCLSRLADQRDVGEVQVVLVDGGSRDGTVAEARRQGATVLAAPAGPYSSGGALHWLTRGYRCVVDPGVRRARPHPRLAAAHLRPGAPGGRGLRDVHPLATSRPRELARE